MRRRILVIGGGPGGYTAALRACQLGAEVILIEKGKLGGTCLNTGCIPAKSLLDSSHAWAKSKKLFPRQLQGEVPWSEILARKNKAVQQLRLGLESLLRAARITVVQGEASLTPEKQVIVNGERHQTYTADAIILAVGGRPVRPPIPGIDLPGVVTSDELLELEGIPNRLAIIGGGVIGIEFATVFAEIGVKVHVVEGARRILPSFDASVSLAVQKHLEEQQVTFSLANTVERIVRRGDDRLSLILAQGQAITADRVLVAVGRETLLEPLKPEAAGIQVEGGKIKVNAFQMTNRHGIYAVGDCASPFMLAHAAMAEGRVAAEHAMGKQPEPIAYDMVPQSIYSHPEAAMVGLTKEEAVKRGFDVAEGIFPLAASGRAFTEGERNGFIKLVAEKKYGRILGVHICAPHASEIIGEAALALTLEATVDELIATIHPHPTVVEGMQEAALAITSEVRQHP